MRNYTDFFGPGVTLNGAIIAADTTISLAGVPQLFLDRLVSGADRLPIAVRLSTTVADMELVLLTAYDDVADTWTVERAIDDTTAKAHANGAVAVHPVGSGDVFERDVLESQIIKPSFVKAYANFNTTFSGNADGFEIASGHTLSVAQGSATVDNDGILITGTPSSIVFIDGITSFNFVKIRVHATFGADTDIFGIVYNYTDASNFFYSRISVNNGQIVEVDAGSETVLVSESRAGGDGPQFRGKRFVMEHDASRGGWQQLRVPGFTSVNKAFTASENRLGFIMDGNSTLIQRIVVE